MSDLKIFTVMKLKILNSFRTSCIAQDPVLLMAIIQCVTRKHLLRVCQTGPNRLSVPIRFTAKNHSWVKLEICDTEIIRNKPQKSRENGTIVLDLRGSEFNTGLP